MLFNKVTGLYGILAIFTGYELNPLQFSHYVYSLLVFVLVAWLAPSIRNPEEPLKNLALAWLYVLDSLVNNVYTALFGTSWFVVLARSLNNPALLYADKVDTLGAGTIEDTSGFTDPEHKATNVEVVAKPGPGLMGGQVAVAYASTHGTFGQAVFQSGSIMSLTVLGLVWMVRVYLCLIIMSHARSVLRHYVASTSDHYSQSDDATLAENPFRAERQEGEGWRGRLGRLMLRYPSKRYWLGRDEHEYDWMRATSGRFESGRRGGLRIKVPGSGLGERERRARSGTGPSAPAPPLGYKDKTPS